MNDALVNLQPVTVQVSSLTLRIGGVNTKKLDFEKLEDTLPAFVTGVGRSNDPTQSESSFIADCAGCNRIGHEEVLILQQWTEDARLD